MKIVIDSGPVTVIRLSGQLDTLTSVDLEKDIREVLETEVKEIILDGTGLTYVSSAGLRLLLTLQKGMNAKSGKFILRNIREEIREILNITGFSSFLTIE